MALLLVEQWYTFICGFRHSGCEASLPPHLLRTVATLHSSSARWCSSTVLEKQVVSTLDKCRAANGYSYSQTTRALC